MMPGTSLPTSTLSYHLDASCYFREPAARVHLHHWKVLRFMQGAFAALFLRRLLLCGQYGEPRQGG